MQTNGRKRDQKKMLKFKVWDKEKQVFLKDVYISQDGELYEFSTFTTFRVVITYLNSENKKVLKFTGLHDKNGSEIYEGDVLRIKDGLYRVAWNGCFSSFFMKNLEKDKKYDDLYFLNANYKSAEIIGNIYENEEFLKNEKN